MQKEIAEKNTLAKIKNNTVAKEVIQTIKEEIPVVITSNQILVSIYI